jgi:DNA-binding NtrC family response regulator
MIHDDGPPVILIDDAGEASPVVAAIRAGACDVVHAGIAAETFAAIVTRHVESFRGRRHLANRNRRLRGVSRRLIRDRRELRERVDLICRDLVHAYRRLAEKAVKTPGFGEIDYSSSESSNDL